ncbi:hypothetical protein NDU88_006100 [Pleurodeles waltl]|uniref:Uncharacterized protein n=1 Tax=Pleurodeles waltl TaxID=8319 RepID=A0AAV7NTE4_PLEWA|nr:hypothetical protein NDU88_006100 [Pleurodeles waltl]
MNTGAGLRTRFVAAGGTAGRGGTRAIGPRAAGDAKGVAPAAAGSPVGARWPNSGHARHYSTALLATCALRRCVPFTVAVTEAQNIPPISERGISFRIGVPVHVLPGNETTL